MRGHRPDQNQYDGHSNEHGNKLEQANVASHLDGLFLVFVELVNYQVQHCKVDQGPASQALDDDQRQACGAGGLAHSHAEADTDRRSQ